MSATYTFRDAGGDVVRSSPFGIPTPVHAMTPAADDAREAVRRFAWRRKIDRAVASLVTEHGHPAVEPYAHPRPDAASRLARAAEAKGWRVNVFETPGNVRSVVEGVRGREAFRCTWLRGRAESGTWHERDYRYALVHDTRPVGVAKISLTGLAGKRAAGVGETRLSIVASPVGIPIGVSSVVKKVSES